MKRILKITLMISVLSIITGNSCSKTSKSENENNINGVWKVKALSISDELTNIDTLPEDAPYSDISILIPDTRQEYIKGNTVYNSFTVEFEIKEHQQISFKNLVMRPPAGELGEAFKENMLNTLKFNISNNELIFIDVQNKPVIIFIKKN